MQSWQFFTVYGNLEYRLASFSAAEIVVVRRYLSTLTTLELAVPTAGDNLDTDQASVWTRNKAEFSDRIRLLDEWRQRLCGFIGVPAGPSLSGATGYLTV